MYKLQISFPGVNSLKYETSTKKFKTCSSPQDCLKVLLIILQLAGAFLAKHKPTPNIHLRENNSATACG